MWKLEKVEKLYKFELRTGGQHDPEPNKISFEHGQYFTCILPNDAARRDVTSYKATLSVGFCRTNIVKMTF